MARGALGSARVRVATKVTLACAAAYAAATLVVHVPAPAAAMVPLIVFRTTDPWRVWRGVVGRLPGVVLGVGLATLILVFSEASWWWVALIVIVSAALQALPKIGDILVHNWQVAISAILVLGVGAGPYGGERLVESVIASVVTVLVAVLIWPPDAPAELTRRVDGVAADLAKDLRSVESLIDADPALVRTIEDGVLQHLVAARQTMEEVLTVRRSLRSGIYRWSSTRLRRVDEQAARLVWLTDEAQTVSSLARGIDALDADPRCALPTAEDRAQLREGCNAVAQAVLDPAGRTGVLDRLDAVLGGGGAATDPWRRALGTPRPADLAR
jgi:uncharacterized membrane protein YgaE (UPF0421/DUF939 family)